MPVIGYYCSSKWAFEAIHESLAAEVKPFGIKVTIIEPGAYATEFGSQDSLKFAAGLDIYTDFETQSFPDFKTVHSQILQDVLKRLDKSLQHFFRRVKQGDTPGFPCFKGKDRFHSISYPQSGFGVTGSWIYLSGMGKVRLRVHRDITRAMRIKTCTIKKSGNHWYGILSVELQSAPVPKQVVTNPVGIDLGLATFATISNGEIIDNPRSLRHSEKKLAIIQAAYALRKTKAFKRKMTNLHQKIANQRCDFLHKESTKLVNRFDLIAYEDLSIKNMAQRCKPVQTEGGGFASNGQTPPKAV